MISNYDAMVIYTLVAVASIIIGLYGLNWIDKYIRKPVIQGTRDLADPNVRAQLEAFLARHMIVGEADIRHGCVSPPAYTLDHHGLATVLEDAAARLHRMKNPASCSLYVRDSVEDRWYILGELDLDHLVEAARILRRVAGE